MGEGVTAWQTIPGQTFTHRREADLPPRIHRGFTGVTATHDQWEDIDGDPTPIDPDDLRVQAMRINAAADFEAGTFDFLSTSTHSRYTRNRLLSGWYLPQQYVEQLELGVAVTYFTDPAHRGWAYARENLDPDPLLPGNWTSYVIEWEGWEPGEVFGEFSNRRIEVNNYWQQQEWNVYDVNDDGSGPGPLNPGRNDYPSPNLWYGPDLNVRAGVTPVPTFSATNASDKWGNAVNPATYPPNLGTVAELLDSDPLVNVDGQDNILAGERESYDLDSVMAANGVDVQETSNFTIAGSLPTRSLLLSFAPRFDQIQDQVGDGSYRGNFLDESPAWFVQNSVFFTPPRWRVRYQTLSDPYRRIHPRHDDLAGGAGTVWPTPRSEQGSNRIVGGYL